MELFIMYFQYFIAPVVIILFKKSIVAAEKSSLKYLK